MARSIDRTKEWQKFMERFYDPRNRFLQRTRIHPEDPPENILKIYVQAKHSEGCSIETIETYFSTVRNFLYWNASRSVSEITGNDVKDYLNDYQVMNGCGNHTLDTIRRALNSFFQWLFVEEYLEKNPMLKVHKIKYDYVLEMPFTDEEMERIRDSCINIRELALIDFLYSTGVRVSECSDCDIDDVNIREGETKVMGKGKKERIVYLDTRSKVHLGRYIEERQDHNCALFVRAQAPYDRMSKSGIEYICKDIGARAQVPNCHPHRFRRTLATRLLERGMPIEQVQRILGHTKLDTTLIYAHINQANVKANHSKYI